ncbi:MAG: LytTR family transcriptional regulator DNA-binding domain-containing protein [Myxacorys californica WJT36-NPBG1]|nr:LytTR family transcriptional regulator DNA-binding domain-containing protein [Myxacorys californica WJT36-NPBG1]
MEEEQHVLHYSTLSAAVSDNATSFVTIHRSSIAQLAKILGLCSKFQGMTVVLFLKGWRIITIFRRLVR